jgi:hypothetical protein
MTRDLGTEVVVVDSATDQAHALTGLSAQVWRSLDEGRLPSAPEAELATVVQELNEAGLLELGGMSRRTLLRRAGTVAVAGGVITIAMPEVMAAASGTATTTGLTGTPIVAGSSTLTASVTAGATPVTVGTLTIFEVTGGVTTQKAQGPAPSLQYTANPATGRTYRAVYTPGTGFAGSTSSDYSPVAPQPQTIGTTTTLAAGTGGIDKRKSKSWPAVVTVTQASGTVKPTGTVTLTTTGGATSTPATAPLDANGQATFTVTNTSTSGLPVRVSASYGGNTATNPQFTGSSTSTSGDITYTSTT